ncbi:unnamed protein product, partial [Rotaria sordida]
MSERLSLFKSPMAMEIDEEDPVEYIFGLAKVPLPYPT